QLFLLMPPPPPSSTLFPYTTLFRSRRAFRGARADGARRRGAAVGSRRQPRSLPGARREDGGGDRRRGAEGAESPGRGGGLPRDRSEEHTSELQSRSDLVCRLLLEKK